MDLLLQLLLNALVNASIFSLLAVGFGIVYRSMRFFYIAYGGIYVFASYSMIALQYYLHLPAQFFIPLSVLAAVSTSLLMERVIYLPLDRRGATPAVLFVVSLGAYVFIINGIALVFGSDIKVLSKELGPSFALGSLTITRMQVLQLLVGVVLLFAFWALIRKNNYMKGIWAMGETPELVRVLGLPFELMRMAVYLISSAFAAVASILVAFDTGMDPYVGMRAVLTAAVAVLVGGVNVFWGWIGGAILLAVLQSMAVWQFPAKWSDLITFGILVCTLIFRPQGLFSPRKRREES
jgi:branched-chain amino acid transport system permease protein